MQHSDAFQFSNLDHLIKGHFPIHNATTPPIFP